MGKEFIHLAFFDGVDTAELALEEVIGRPLAYLSWETCPDCIRVLDRHFPHVQHRGDVDADNPSELAKTIQQIDPSGLAIIFVSGGPPCPDFSGIAASAQGKEGHEGSKFVRFSKFLSRLEKLVKSYKSVVQLELGEEFPEDPKAQLWGAVGAVFNSWMNQRAKTYRPLVIVRVCQSESKENSRDHTRSYLDALSHQSEYVDMT